MSDAIALEEYGQRKILFTVGELRRETWFRRMKPDQILVGGRSLGDELIKPGDFFTEVWDLTCVKNAPRDSIVNRRDINLAIASIKKYNLSLDYLDPNSNMYVAIMLAGEGVNQISQSSILIGAASATFWS